MRAGAPFRETFHVGDQEVRGLIVERLPDLFKDGKLVLYRRSPGEDRWQRLEEELSQPEEQSQSEFPVWYQLTLDANGTVTGESGATFTLPSSSKRRNAAWLRFSVQRTQPMG